MVTAGGKGEINQKTSFLNTKNNEWTNCFQIFHGITLVWMYGIFLLGLSGVYWCFFFSMKWLDSSCFWGLYYLGPLLFFTFFTFFLLGETKNAWYRGRKRGRLSVVGGGAGSGGGSSEKYFLVFTFVEMGFPPHQGLL